MFEPQVFAESTIGSHLWSDTPNQVKNITEIRFYPSKALLLNRVSDELIFLPEQLTRFNNTDGIKEDILRYEIAGFISSLAAGNWASFISLISNIVAIPDEKYTSLWYDLRDVVISHFHENKILYDGFVDVMNDVKEYPDIINRNCSIVEQILANKEIDFKKHTKVTVEKISDKWSKGINDTYPMQVFQQDLMNWLYEFRLYSIEESR